MNVLALIEFMGKKSKISPFYRFLLICSIFTAFTMNVNGVTTLNCGKHLQIVSIVYQLQLLVSSFYFFVSELVFL